MRDLSVRGIAIRYGSQDVNLSLRDWLKTPDTISDDGSVTITPWELPSLRQRLEDIARKERDDITVNNCPDISTDIITTAAGTAVGALVGAILGGALGGLPGALLGSAVGSLMGADWGYHEGFLIKWRAKFEQTWTHIVVRIRVVWMADVTSNRNQRLQDWKDQIEFCWNDRWGCNRSGVTTCPFTFEVQWLGEDEPGDHHYVLFVTNNMDRAAYFWWDNRHAGWPAVHEFGHMLGLPDEYQERSIADGGYPCPGRDDPADNVPGTMMGDLRIVTSEWIPSSDFGMLPHPADFRLSNTRWRNYLASNVNNLFPRRYFQHFADELNCQLEQI